MQIEFLVRLYRVPQDVTMTSPLALLRRHQWKNLTEPERDAVSDCMSIAGMRVAVGVGAVLTTAAVIGQGKHSFKRVAHRLYNLFFPVSCQT